MNSFLYEGFVRHRRFAPCRHAFRYRLAMLYLDLDELDTAFRGRWLWSARRFALARFRREDHFGDPNQPLEACVRDLVFKETGRQLQGPIRLLTHPRYFGYVFNPISLYYCFDAAGERVELVVAEVTNTPWGDRICYVLDAGRPRRFAKAMHVSPFMPMDLDYLWRAGEPGRNLVAHLDVIQAGRTLFDATLVLKRRKLDGPVLARVLLRFPTFKVIAAIHWQALRLWLKRVPVHARPVHMEAPS